MSNANNRGFGQEKSAAMPIVTGAVAGGLTALGTALCTDVNLGIGSALGVVGGAVGGGLAGMAMADVFGVNGYSAVMAACGGVIAGSITGTVGVGIDYRLNGPIGEPGESQVLNQLGSVDWC